MRAPSKSASWSRSATVNVYFRQAMRALAANKVRAGLSTLGILIGVASVIAMMAIGQGPRAASRSSCPAWGPTSCWSCLDLPKLEEGYSWARAPPPASRWKTAGRSRTSSPR